MGAKIALFSLGLAILFCLGAGASEQPPEPPKQVEEGPVDTGDLKQTAGTLFKLNHLVDLWHDANLKGNTRSIDKYEHEIFQLLRKDIRVSHQFVDHRLQELRCPDQKDGKTDEVPTSADQNVKSPEGWQELEDFRRLLSTNTSTARYSGRGSSRKPVSRTRFPSSRRWI